MVNTMWKGPIIRYSEIKNILITTVIDNKFNDIELVYKLELAADKIYDELLSRELQIILERNDEVKDGKNS